jgi:hypothetical protein
MQTGGVGTPQIVQGLQGASQYAGVYLQQMAQDKTQQQAVKQFSDQMGQIMNLVKAMAQRQQEIMQKKQQENGKPDPAEIAKLQMEMASSQQKMKEDHDKHVQKMTQQQQKFESDMTRKQLSHSADEQRKTAQTLGDIHNKSLTASANAAIAAQNKPEEKSTEE